MQLARLVRTKAIWIDWRLEQDSCDDMARLLRALVGDAEPMAPSGEPDHAPAVSEPTQRWLGIYRNGDGNRRRLEWVSAGGDAVAHVAQIYARLMDCLSNYRGDALDHLNAAECQVLLGPEATRRLTNDHSAHTASMCALIDLDFQRSRRLKTVDYRCNVRLSMWSGWPRGRTLPEAPAAAQHPVFEEITDELLVRFRDGTDALLRGFTALLSDCFEETELHIFGRRYLPPQFFIAVPTGDVSLPALLDHAGSDGSLLTMARRFLDAGHVDDTTVAVSVVKGELIALRRFVPSQRSRTDEPSYVIVQTWPGGLQLADEGPMLVWRRGHGATEGADDADPDDEHVHPVIRSFTELERQVADNLLQLTADTRLDQHHVDVYGAIAHRVGHLWDGLALHMPTSKGDTLDRVHTAVQVLHEILLQGVADLAEIVSSIGRTRAEYERVRETLMQRYQRAISERSGRSNPTIGSSMVDTGHFRRLATSITSARARAHRVQESYAGLLDAINKAFDERRARESDVLERSSFQLGRALGLLALVTIADFLAAQAQWQLPPRLQQGLRIAGLAMAAYVVISVARSIRRARVAGRIMKPRFAGTFRDLQLFLRSISTAQLEAFRRDDANPTAERGRRHGRPSPLDRRRRSAAPTEKERWHRKDTELATEFARLWDCAADPSQRPPAQRLRTALRGGQSRRLDADLAAIEDDIRAWTIRALLASERPRALDEFRLPQLACMYRLVHHCVGGSGFGDLSLLSLAEWSKITRSLGIDDYERHLDWWAQQQGHRWHRAEDLLRDLKLRLSELNADLGAADAGGP